MLISPDDASQEHHTLTGMLPRCKRYAEHKVESKTAECNIRGFTIHAKVFFFFFLNTHAKFMETKGEVLETFK